jgi:hypothetical protein
MNKYSVTLTIGVLAVLLFSCEQYAIFDAIAQEVKPKPALIRGVASKIVGNDNKVYVANGELWEYTITTNKWNKVSDRTDVRDVAIVDSNVFMISMGNSPSVSILDGGTIDAPVQGIYGANDKFFAAVGEGKSYSVHVSNDGSTHDPITSVSGLLKGAAYYTGNYYLATSSGLYHSTNGATFTRIEEGNFLGVVAFTNKAVAVTGSAVYEAAGNTASQKVSADSLTGALSVDGDTLYLGRSRGYRIIDTSAATWELDSPSTETNYSSTIAQVRVTSIYAVSNGVIFASVLSSEPKRSGLMSLRGGSWNMEE